MNQPLSLAVLQKWHLSGDGSRFCKGHLELAELRELTDEDRSKVLALYAAGKIQTYVAKLLIFEPFSKPEIAARCKLPLSRYLAQKYLLQVEPLIEKQKEPGGLVCDLWDAVESGLYDADCLSQKEVSTGCLALFTVPVLVAFV